MTGVAVGVSPGFGRSVGRYSPQASGADSLSEQAGFEPAVPPLENPRSDARRGFPEPPARFQHSRELTPQPLLVGAVRVRRRVFIEEEPARGRLRQGTAAPPLDNRIRPRGSATTRRGRSRDRASTCRLVCAHVPHVHGLPRYRGCAAGRTARDRNGWASRDQLRRLEAPRRSAAVPADLRSSAERLPRRRSCPPPYLMDHSPLPIGPQRLLYPSRRDCLVDLVHLVDLFSDLCVENYQGIYT